MVTGNIRGMRGSATAPVLRRVEDLQTYTIGATDGDIGTVADLYFDDQSWTARYVVVDTGGWLSGRKVLIPPRAIQQIDAAGQRLVTNLTRQQVEDSPGIDTERPVSRPYEIDLYGYYGYPYYWEGRRIRMPLPTPPRLLNPPGPWASRCGLLWWKRLRRARARARIRIFAVRVTSGATASRPPMESWGMSRTSSWTRRRWRSAT